MTIGSKPVTFRFDAERHEYFIGDQRVPSATQLIEMGGLLKGAEYFTDEHRRRGTAVHDLATDYDLGALTQAQIDASKYRGFALAYIDGSRALQPNHEYIEVASVHPVYRFGVRSDRLAQAENRWRMVRPTVLEIKSGAKAKHHPVQTALQALDAAVRWNIPPDWWKSIHTERMIQRLCMYVKRSGKFTVETHEDPRDFVTALGLIKDFCR